jgi:hypothetical protein
VPSQNQLEIARLGLDWEESQKRAWLVSPTGGLQYQGAEAIFGALSILWQRPLLLQLYRLPLIRHCADLVYWMVSKIRRFLPIGIPYCSLHPEECQRIDKLCSGTK